MPIVNSPPRIDLQVRRLTEAMVSGLSAQRPEVQVPICTSIWTGADRVHLVLYLLESKSAKRLCPTDVQLSSASTVIRAIQA